MLPLNELNTPRRKVCGVFLVFVVVCSLAASVTTRYTSSFSAPSKTVVVQKSLESEPGRQRLTMSTANWLPVVIVCAILQSRQAFRRVPSSDPLLISTFLGQNLYNRPPPSPSLL